MRIYYYPFLFICLASAVASAATFSVHDVTNLQSSINAAAPGDTIILDAGVTYVTNITLPNKPGGQFITIQSSAVDHFPTGIRVSPADTAFMPKLMAPNGAAVILATAGAHH